MLEKTVDFQKLMFLTNTSEDIDAQFRYIALKKTSIFFEVVTPMVLWSVCLHRKQKVQDLIPSLD